MHRFNPKPRGRHVTHFTHIEQVQRSKSGVEAAVFAEEHHARCKSPSCHTSCGHSQISSLHHRHAQGVVQLEIRRRGPECATYPSLIEIFV